MSQTSTLLARRRDSNLLLWIITPPELLSSLGCQQFKLEIYRDEYFTQYPVLCSGLDDNTPKPPK